MRSQKGRCSFLSAPLEIRHAIYALILPRAVHVFLSRGRLRLSMCLDPNLGDDNHDGRERKPGTDTDTDHEHRSKWARRLRSSWGPHWECEESVYGDCYLDVDSLILLCKQVSLEVSDRLADIATINVTDLDTLDTLLRCDRSGVAFDSRWLKNVRDLRLTFRLPLAFYRKLEDGEEEEEENMIAGQMSTDSTASRISWARLWPAILESRQLRTLQI
ncbi:hypothetical protein F5Y08DRAFT_319490 [Xylaria arbuscula]|nr:hypothetical protein F5Y08DRAFT_319490 [Xylaria arbuscula]